MEQSGVGRSGVTELTRDLAYFIVSDRNPSRVTAAFVWLGSAAAYLDRMGWERKFWHLVDRDGNEIERVRFRGDYGHAAAILDSLSEAERTQGWRDTTTGRQSGGSRPPVPPLAREAEHTPRGQSA